MSNESFLEYYLQETNENKKLWLLIYNFSSNFTQNGRICYVFLDL